MGGCLAIWKTFSPSLVHYSTCRPATTLNPRLLPHGQHDILQFSPQQNNDRMSTSVMSHNLPLVTHRLDRAGHGSLHHPQPSNARQTSPPHKPRYKSDRIPTRKRRSFSYTSYRWHTRASSLLASRTKKNGFARHILPSHIERLGFMHKVFLFSRLCNKKDHCVLWRSKLAGERQSMQASRFFKF